MRGPQEGELVPERGNLVLRRVRLGQERAELRVVAGGAWCAALLHLRRGGDEGVRHEVVHLRRPPGERDGGEVDLCCGQLLLKQAILARSFLQHHLIKVMEIARSSSSGHIVLFFPFRRSHRLELKLMYLQ